MTITICVCTKDRPLYLKRCICSILKSTILPDEIIIINEGKDIDLLSLGQRFVSKINIINSSTSSLSKGRNHAVTVATSDVVCFTDDDCIVDSQWIQACLKVFKHNHSCVGVFGTIKPYQPGRHIREICPSTFRFSKQKIISKPCYHATKIGFGNNMAFRKEIFTEIGNFKSWLGIGSVGLSAEDAEFALSALIKNNIIINNPNMIIFHDKWLSGKQMHYQNLLYYCGEMACYGYLLFQGFKFAKPVVKNNINDSYYKLHRVIKKLIILKWRRNLFLELKLVIVEIVYRLRGLSIGLFYSIFDPIN
ncbi:MAG TPA: glycosyltransferase [Candidatus Saccharimonadales bacterium]|nr:glycosyltransferase [Candidatus Saccharimonadales bacterium]